MSVLVKQAGIISAADFLRLLVKTIIGILLARVLTQAEYGTYRQLFMIYTLIAAIFMIGLPQSVYYFIPKSDASARKKFIRQTIDLFMLLGLLSSALLLIFRHSIAVLFNNPQLSKMLILYAFYPFFMFLSQLYYSVMIGLQKPRKAALFIIFSVACDFILILGTAIITRNLVYITIALVVSVFLQWLYARISLQAFSFKEKLFFYDKELLKSQFKYALPIGVAAIIGVVSAQIDKLVISSHFSPELFAIFSVGAAELPFIGIITNSVNAVILPEMSKSNNPQAISELYRGAIRKNALIIFPIFAFCFVFATKIIQLLYSAKYLDAVVFFRIYLITMPIRIATYSILFQVFNKTKYIFLISLLTLILNFTFSMILINILGLVGPAISTTVVTFIAVSIYLLLIKYKIGLKLSNLFPIVALARTLFASLISAGICVLILLIHMPYYLQFILGTILYFVVYYFVGNFVKAILPYDKSVIKSVITGSIQKIRGLAHV